MPQKNAPASTKPAPAEAKNSPRVPLGCILAGLAIAGIGAVAMFALIVIGLLIYLPDRNKKPDDALVEKKPVEVVKKPIEPVDVKPIEKPPPEVEFEQLFNGKDLTGWSHYDDKFRRSWQVEDGYLVGIGNKGKTASGLVSDTMVASDFHLRMEFRTSDETGRFSLRFRQARDNKIISPPSIRRAACSWVTSFEDPSVKAGVCEDWRMRPSSRINGRPWRSLPRAIESN